MTNLLTRLKELESKATPGEWGFGSTDDDKRLILGNSGEGGYVANVQIYQTPRIMGLYAEAEREANATLIAESRNALPKLIEALEVAREQLEYIADSWPHDMRAIAGSDDECVQGCRACGARRDLKRIDELLGGE